MVSIRGHAGFHNDILVFAIAAMTSKLPVLTVRRQCTLIATSGHSSHSPAPLMAAILESEQVQGVFNLTNAMTEKVV